MVEFKLTNWTKMFLFLILILQLRAVTGHDFSFTVTDGDDVTLPCENKIKHQDKCNSTTWLFINMKSSLTVELVILGQISKEAKSKSDRLSVTENCSLFIKEVTVNDFGHYHCRQYNKSGQRHCEDALVALSVVTIDEQKNDDKVTLNCSVMTFGRCRHVVRWLQQDTGDEVIDLKSSNSFCFAAVTFLTSHINQTSKHSESFTCLVADGENLLLCNLASRSSCEKIATGQLFSFTIRAGDYVTLPCKSTRHDERKCDSTTWLYMGSGNTTAVSLFEHGRIHRGAKSKSDRLSVTENCSLVIKKVTDEDVGLYDCVRFKSGLEQSEDTASFLSTVNMTEDKDDHNVTLTCSVSTHDWCKHTVKWLLEDEFTDGDIEISQSDCSAIVRFSSSLVKHKPTYLELFTCVLTDEITGKVQLFNFSPHSSGWLRVIVVSVGLTALIISVVTVQMWTGPEGNNTKMEAAAVHYNKDEDDGTLIYESIGNASL